MLKLTKEEVVLRTVELISVYGRSIDQDDNCKYINNEQRCAFGLWLINPEEFEDGAIARTLLEDNGYFILKPEVSNIKDVNFWSRLQILHDSNSYWHGKELTNKGKKYIYSAFNVIIK